MSTFSRTGGPSTLNTNKMLKQLNSITKTKPNAPMSKELADANSHSMERINTPKQELKPEALRYSSVKPKERLSLKAQNEAKVRERLRNETFAEASAKFFDSELDLVEVPTKSYEPIKPERDGQSPTLEGSWGRRGRSPGMPKQKMKEMKEQQFQVNQSQPNLPSYKILSKMHDKLPVMFDENGDKSRLHALFSKENRTSIPIQNTAPTYDDLTIGVKVYEDRLKQKNKESADTYHMISNLTNEQIKDKVNYDGVTKEVLKTSNQSAMDYLSERKKLKQDLQSKRKTERPMPMRSELVESYFSKVMKDTGGDDGEMHDVFGEIYRYAMDNRIFNNLK